MPIFTSDLTSSGIIYADTIVTNSNEDLTLNPAGTGSVVANARLKVNEISADDSTSVSIKSPIQLDSTLQVVGAINANGTGNSILVSDTLRIAQNGSGLRMTNVGAFDNDGSDNFRIFSTNDLIFSSNGDSNTALTIDGTTQNVTINQDLGVTGTITSTGLTAGTIQISGNTITSTNSNEDITLNPLGTGRVVVENELVVNTISSDDSTNIRVADNLVPDADNTYSLGTPDRKWSALYVTGQTIFLDETKLQVDGSGDFTVKDAGNNLKRVVASEVEIGTGSNKIKIQRGNNGKVKFLDENDTPTPVLQIVGDDSTGVSLNTNETVKIAGAQNITTAVSGDTLTITGPDLSAYITAASTDTLTNKTFDANGTGNSISNIEVGDFASGEILDEDNMSSNSATKLATQQSIKAYVDSVAGGTLSLGDSASNSGSVDVNSGDNLEFRAGNSITPTVAGNGVTIALNDTIVVNAISSTDSSTVRINDSIETENAQINTNLTVDGNAQVKGNLTVQGTTTYIETTNTKISDPLLLLSNGNSGGSDIDAGIMIERGSAGNNAVFYWNEGDDKFKAVTTTSGEDATAITDTATATIVADLEGDVTASTITVNEISANDSSAVSIKSPLQLDSTLQSGAITATGNIDITGNAIFSGNLTVQGSLVTDDISSDSNANITITANGTGAVVVESLQIQGNQITATDSTQIAFGQQQLTDVADPTSDQDVATKAYVDNNSGSTTIGFTNSTTTEFPTFGDSSATDFSNDEPEGVGTAASGTDAFGVALSGLYDCMEPSGSLLTNDFGSSESHVGA